MPLGDVLFGLLLFLIGGIDLRVCGGVGWLDWRLGFVLVHLNDLISSVPEGKGEAER